MKIKKHPILQSSLSKNKDSKTKVWSRRLTTQIQLSTPTFSTTKQEPLPTFLLQPSLQFVTPAREDNDKEEANGLSLRAPNFHFLCTVSIAFT